MIVSRAAPMQPTRVDRRQSQFFLSEAGQNKPKRSIPRFAKISLLKEQRIEKGS